MKCDAKSNVLLVAVIALVLLCLWFLLAGEIGQSAKNGADSASRVDRSSKREAKGSSPIPQPVGRPVEKANNDNDNGPRKESPLPEEPPTEAMLDVRLADGAPLPHGRVRLVTVGYFSEVVRVYDGQPVRLGPFAGGCNLEVIVGHDLPEYERYPKFSFAAKDVASNKVLKCIIPLATEPQSALDIDLSCFPPALRLKVSVDCALGGVFSKECVGGELYKTPLTQADWVLQVKIDGDAKWRSGDIKLIAGQRVYVRPALEEPASVRFKITNAQGESVSAALVTCESTAMAQYKRLITLPAGTSVTGEYALSGADGVAKLGGLRSGDYGLLVYAEGYEPKSVYGAFVSGKETDLGTIVLDKKQ